MNHINFLTLILCFFVSASLRAETDETVVVTGTKTSHRLWESPVPTEVLRVDDYTLQHHQSVGDLLALTPGLQVVRGIRGEVIRIQGLDEKYTLVLVNGQRLGGRIGEAYDLDSIPMEGIERIEIIKGAASALYGSDAIGGVINIITQEKVRQRVKIHADSNGRKDARLSTGIAGEDLSVTGEVFGHKNRALALQGTDATQFSASEKIGAQLSPKYSHQSFVIKSRLESSEETLNATEISAAGAILSRENELKTQSLAMEPQLYLTEDSELKLILRQDFHEDLYTQSLRRTGQILTREETKEKIQEVGVEGNLRWINHSLSAGVQNLDEFLNSDRLASDSVSRERHALYAQDEAKFFDDKLTLIPAVRWDSDSQFGEHFSPKLAMRFAYDTNNAWMLSYGQGYRAPSFKELYLLFENNSVGYSVEGNPGLKPESSRSSNFQYSFQDGDGLQLSVNGFHTSLVNMIENKLLSQDSLGQQVYSYENISRAENLGGSVTLSKQFKPQFKGTAGYHFLQARDLTRQVALTARSKHSLDLGLEYSWQALRIQSRSKWLSAREASESASLSNRKSIFTGDLSVSFKHGSAWLYSLALENISASAGDIYWQIPPRSLGFSLTWMPVN